MRERRTNKTQSQQKKGNTKDHRGNKLDIKNIQKMKKTKGCFFEKNKQNQQTSSQAYHVEKTKDPNKQNKKQKRRNNNQCCRNTKKL